MMNKTLHRYKHWFYNYKVKIFCLLCALFLWFYVVTDNRFNHTIRVPVTLINQPQGLILRESVPSKIKVQFRGSGKELLSLLYREKRIELDLQQVRREKMFAITTDMIKGIPLGTAVRPQRIVEPDSITIRLDQFAAKQVPIVSDISVIPADGYIQVGDIKLIPDSILVSGPQSLVKGIDEVRTDTRTYQSVIKRIEDKLPLIPPEWATVNYGLKNVRFVGDVQRIGERTITEIPVNVIRVPRGLKVIVVPSTLSLKVQGGVSLLAELDRNDIVATIDYRRRQRYRQKRIPAGIDVPEGITFSDARPEFFELVVER
jgi:YbbR domain-containing protein